MNISYNVMKKIECDYNVCEVCLQRSRLLNLINIFFRYIFNDLVIKFDAWKIFHMKPFSNFNVFINFVNLIKIKEGVNPCVAYW